MALWETEFAFGDGKGFAEDILPSRSSIRWWWCKWGLIPHIKILKTRNSTFGSHRSSQIVTVVSVAVDVSSWSISGSVKLCTYIWHEVTALDRPTELQGRNILPYVLATLIKAKRWRGAQRWTFRQDVNIMYIDSWIRRGMRNGKPSQSVAASQIDWFE